MFTIHMESIIRFSRKILPFIQGVVSTIHVEISKLKRFILIRPLLCFSLYLWYNNFKSNGILVEGDIIFDCLSILS